jgi:hypothetical protein
VVPSSPPPGIDTSSSSTHHQHGDSCADCTSSCDPSVSLPPLPPAVKPRVLAIKLQPLWEDDKCEWSVETVTRRVRGYFPSAPPGYCQQVYRHLQSTRSTLDDKQQNDLLQGFARCMQKRGWSVTILTASGSTVLMQAVDMAAAKFNAKERKERAAGLRAVFDVVGALLANLDRFPDVDSTGAVCSYAMGWLICPPDTLGTRLGDFVPVTALDWCSASGAAQGSFIVRATHDADCHKVPVTVAKVLCCEAIPGCEVFHAEEEAAHGGSTVVSQTLNAPHHTHITDNGRALQRCNKNANPAAGGHILDVKHMKDRLSATPAGRNAKPHYERLHASSQGFANHVRAELHLLQISNPSAYQTLAAYGFENLFPALLTPPAGTHGTITSNDAEVLNFMLQRAKVRSQKAHVDSLSATVHLLCRMHHRRVAIRDSVVRRYGAEYAQPPRLLHDMCMAQQQLESLGECTQVSGEVFSVRSSRSTSASVAAASAQHSAVDAEQSHPTYDVRPRAAAQQQWVNLCQAGCPLRKHSSICKHFLQVLMSSPEFGNAPYLPFQKPFTTMAGWNRTLDPCNANAWEPPTWAEVVAETAELRAQGKLSRLFTPDIQIETGGKPSKLKACKEARHHTVVENALSTTGTVDGDVLLRSVLGNAHAKSGPKTGAVKCSTCHALGHHAGNCNLSRQMLGIRSPNFTVPSTTAVVSTASGTSSSNDVNLSTLSHAQAPLLSSPPPTAASCTQLSDRLVSETPSPNAACTPQQLQRRCDPASRIAEAMHPDETQLSDRLVSETPSPNAACTPQHLQRRCDPVSRIAEAMHPDETILSPDVEADEPRGHLSSNRDASAEDVPPPSEALPATTPHPNSPVAIFPPGDEVDEPQGHHLSNRDVSADDAPPLSAALPPTTPQPHSPVPLLAPGAQVSEQEGHHEGVDLLHLPDSSDEDIDDAAPCVICLRADVHNRTALDNCRHTFCYACISRWCSVSNGWCPSCRSPICALSTAQGTLHNVTPPSAAAPSLGQQRATLAEFRAAEDAEMDVVVHECVSGVVVNGEVTRSEQGTRSSRAQSRRAGRLIGVESTHEPPFVDCTGDVPGASGRDASQLPPMVSSEVAHAHSVFLNLQGPSTDSLQTMLAISALKPLQSKWKNQATSLNAKADTLVGQQLRAEGATVQVFLRSLFDECIEVATTTLQDIRTLCLCHSPPHVYDLLSDALGNMYCALRRIHGALPLLVTSLSQKHQRMQAAMQGGSMVHNEAILEQLLMPPVPACIQVAAEEYKAEAAKRELAAAGYTVDTNGTYLLAFCFEHHATTGHVFHHFLLPTDVGVQSAIFLAANPGKRLPKDISRESIPIAIRQPNGSLLVATVTVFGGCGKRFPLDKCKKGSMTLLDTLAKASVQPCAVLPDGCPCEMNSMTFMSSNLVDRADQLSASLSWAILRQNVSRTSPDGPPAPSPPTSPPGSPTPTPWDALELDSDDDGNPNMPPPSTSSQIHAQHDHSDALELDSHGDDVHSEPQLSAPVPLHAQTLGTELSRSASENRNSPSQLECDSTDEECSLDRRTHPSSAAASFQMQPLRPEIPGPAGDVYPSMDRAETDSEEEGLSSQVSRLPDFIRPTFRLTHAWQWLIYELDNMRLPRMFESRTVISELKEVQTHMPFFELGRGGDAATTALIRLHDDRPFLAVRICVVLNMSESGEMLCEVEDETDRLEATVSAELLHEHGSRIAVGTCLALKQPAMPGGLFLPIAAWSHHLIVTTRSVVLLRTPHDPPPSF